MDAGQAHFHWLKEQKFELPLQQLVFQEYVDAAVAAGKRTDALEAQMHEMLTTWSQRPTAEALMSLRGVSTITAMTVLAELGDLTRFDSPRDLVGFLGLAPGEYSSGSHRRQGAITKTGNDHVRRLLVESAWAYRFPARKTAHLRTQAWQGLGSGARDRLGSAETPLRPVCEALPPREGEKQEGTKKRFQYRGTQFDTHSPNFVAKRKQRHRSEGPTSRVQTINSLCPSPIIASP